ncbi:MAG: hypothetical protein HYV68_01455 [Candidatus Taylorbacteria bacterium]|nr:hypothetical protein [Candidatus Taylorbacteria bacterium]
MKNTFKQVIEGGKKISLTSEEKARIWRYLEAHTKTVPTATGAIHKAWTEQVRWLLAYELSAGRSIMALAALFVVLAGGGTSYAASGALPGEVLYPIKVNFNEKLQTLAALSPESQAALKVNLAAKRLEEAAVLVAENKLTPELADQVSANFEKYEDDAEKQIAKLKGKSATSSIKATVDVSSKLEASLKAHESLLQRLEDNGADEKAVLRLNVSVKARLVEAKENRIKNDSDELVMASSTVGVRAASEGKARAAMNKLEEVTRFVDRKIVGVESEVQTDVASKLQTAKNLYAEGTVMVNSGDFGGAFSKYQDAIRTSQEAKVLVDVGQGIKFKDKQKKEGKSNDRASTAATTSREVKSKSQRNGDSGNATTTLKIEMEREDAKQSDSSIRDRINERVKVQIDGLRIKSADEIKDQIGF